MLKISKQQHEEMAQDLNLNADDLVVRVEEPLRHTPQRGKALLYISEEQDRAMAKDMEERFISKTVRLLEERVQVWCLDKSTEERDQFVRSMIKFARDKNIFKGINIQKLIVWQLDPGFTIPLSKYLESVLNRENAYEEFRMERFFEAITSSVELIEVSADDIF
jgi:hypothetical protein